MGIKTAGKFYTDVATAIPVAVDAPFTFNRNTVTRSVSLDSDNATIKVASPGLYRISANVTYVATEVGVVKAALYADGVAVAGASGSDTVAAVGDTVSVAFSTLLTVKPACIGDVAELTLVNTGVAASYTVDNLIVERVA